MNKNKKAIMWETLLKIVLLLLCLFFLVTAGCKMYASITRDTQEEMLKSHLDLFAVQVNALTYSSKEYIAMPTFLSLYKNNLLVAFDSSEKVSFSYTFGKEWVKIIPDLTIFSYSNTFVKPSQCGSGSCLCLYKYITNAKENKPLHCSKINADYIVSSSLFKTLESNDIWTNFIGDKYNFNSENLDLSNYIKANTDLDANDWTYSLGFHSDILYNFALVSKNNKEHVTYVTDAEKAGGETYNIQLFIEIITINQGKKDLKILIFSPHSSDLTNRKYYLFSHEGEGECNNKYLHEAIKKDSGDYNYCMMGNSGLVESSDEIQICDFGKIKDLCVCGGRAVSSGFCAKNPYSTPSELFYNILINPYNLCQVNEIKKCKDYGKNHYFCLNDICDVTSTYCIWDKNNVKCLDS